VEAERNDARAELNDLRQQFEAVELDRAARLKVIEEQGRRLGEFEADRVVQHEAIQKQTTQIDSLQRQLHSLQSHWLVKALQRLKLIGDRAAPSTARSSRVGRQPRLIGKLRSRKMRPMMISVLEDYIATIDAFNRTVQTWMPSGI